MLPVLNTNAPNYNIFKTAYITLKKKIEVLHYDTCDETLEITQGNQVGSLCLTIKIKGKFKYDTLPKHEMFKYSRKKIKKTELTSTEIKSKLNPGTIENVYFSATHTQI
jgi:hypothetical protein